VLGKFVENLCFSKEMKDIKHLFIVPVGLPGMGKSTFSKHLKRTISASFTRNPFTPVENEMDLREVKFSKISYDRILGEKTKNY
jgi:tRNA uridine 5-carbamoylmethylation protein Kti12